MTLKSIYSDLPFDDYLVLVEKELKGFGLDMMEDERITFEEISEGQDAGMTPYMCAETIKGRLEYDDINDTKSQDSQG